MLSGRARLVDTVGAVPLEDEMGRQEEWEGVQDDDGFLVDLLDGALDLVAVGVRCGVHDVGVKETEGSGEGAADGFRVRAECSDMVTSGVVGGDQLFEAVHDVVLVLGLGA